MVQYEAARIVTGAWKGTSRGKLYEDLSWEPLSNRRIQRKLTLLFEVQKDMFPRYLMGTLESQQYNEGSHFFNRMLLIYIPCQLNKYKASFFGPRLEIEGSIKSVLSVRSSVRSSVHYGLPHKPLQGFF